jgi:microcystin-dependent protein
MPSSNGVYSLPPGYLAATGTTIQVSQHNPIFEDVAAALTLRLSRDGTAPMTGPLNLAPGTAVAPSLIFGGNVGNGFFQTPAGIGISIGATQVAEFTAGGIVGARFVGELFSWSGSSVPSPLCAFPNGQTLSRTAFPTLWTFAQIEITNGNTFYNNGDGATTFGIGDLRGRVTAAADNMGGTAAGRLTTGGSGINGAVLGSVGGAEVATAPLPIHSHGVNDPGHVHAFGSGQPIDVAAGTNNVGLVANPQNNFATTAPAATGILLANAGTGGTHNNAQPSIVTSYLLFAGN